MKSIRSYFPFFLTILITYILMELICAAFVHSGYINARKAFHRIPPKPRPYVADINPYWGIWHPNYIVKMEGDCYEAMYYPNNVGARDVNRKEQGDTNRAIVLGDSYMEGYGVDTSVRVSNRLEKATKTEHLNFGVSSAAPTQYYLIYKHLAKKYTHNQLIIGILPANDLTEDDIDYWKTNVPANELYKPFWVGEYPNYQLQYFIDSLSHSVMTVEGQQKIENRPTRNIGNALRSYTYWFNILDYFRLTKRTNAGYANYLGGEIHSVSPYFEYPHHAFQRLCFNVEKIQEEALGKKITILLIPTQNDIKRYIKAGASKNPLGTELSDWCKTKNIQLLDLLPLIATERKENYMELFLPCDSHWSSEGSQYVAEKLLQAQYAK